METFSILYKIELYSLNIFFFTAPEWNETLALSHLCCSVYVEMNFFHWHRFLFDRLHTHFGKKLHTTHWPLFFLFVSTTLHNDNLFIKSFDFFFISIRSLWTLQKQWTTHFFFRLRSGCCFILFLMIITRNLSMIIWWQNVYITYIDRYWIYVDWLALTWFCVCCCFVLIGVNWCLLHLLWVLFQ